MLLVLLENGFSLHLLEYYNMIAPLVKYHMQINLVRK